MTQQGGWSPQPQGGVPQQPGPYPQPGPSLPQGNPQGGWPPQGGYGQQPGGYGPQPGGFPPGGFGPQGMPPGGFRPAAPPPARGGSSTKIIGIVIGALVVLGLIGGLIAALGGRDKKTTDPAPTITMATPTRPTATATAATTAPTTTAPTSAKPTAAASTGATTGATTAPAGAPVVVGQGISVTPQAGWTVVKQEADFVVLSKGDVVFLAETGKAAPTTTGVQLVDGYLASQAKKMTNVKKNTTTALDVDASVSIGKGLQVGTVTGSSGTEVLAFGVIGSVRKSDGVAFVGTLVWPASADVAPYNTDYTKMVTSMLATQIK